MRVARLLWIVVALAACDGDPKQPPAETPKAETPKTEAPSKPDAKMDPATEPSTEPSTEPATDARLDALPPPAGVLLPEVGTLRTLEPAPKGAAYDWQAIYEVDPADPRLEPIMAEGHAKDAGDAAATLYQRQAKTAGRDVSGAGTYASYPIEGGARTVMILSADHSHRDDATGFSIVVGITGG